MKNDTTCFRISDTGICPHCKSKTIIKNGFTKNRKQQYLCKNCNTRCIDYYINKACCKNINSSIIQLIKEGVGIKSTARILNISSITILKRIILITKSIHVWKTSGLRSVLLLRKLCEVSIIFN